MNFKLTSCEEWGYEEAEGQREIKCKGQLGDVLIRCNNVLYIRMADNVKKPNEPGEMAE